MITFKATLASGDTDVINRWFLKYSGAPGVLTDADCHVIANGAVNEWGFNVKSHISNQYSIYETICEDLSSPVGGLGNDVTPETGTVASASVPGGTALVLKETIARRYRGGHPKVFIAGVPAAALASPDAWDPTSAGNIATGWQTMVTATETFFPGPTLPVVPVNVSRYLGGDWVLYPSGKYRRVPRPRVGGPTTDVITSWIANLRPASQRRRNLQGS